MMGALAFLLVHSWKNRLFTRFRRLKQPKYLFGAIFGLLYFYLYFYRYVFRQTNLGMAGLTGAVPNQEFLTSLAALILFVVIVLAWVIPHERTALVFSEAEVAFLFPAPVSRRTLIHFKLVKSQIAVLFMVIFLTLAFGRFRGGGTAWTRAFGWWTVLCTLNLHLLGASFARTMLLDRGVSNWMRRLAVLALVVLPVAGIGIWAWHSLPPPPAMDADNVLGQYKYYAEQVLSSGPLVYLLYPFRLVVAPRMAADLPGFLHAVGPALLILALHYVWVARSDVAFEEASVEASQKMAEKVAAIRAGKQRPFDRPKKAKRAPFRMAASGPPPVALLWKNLIGAGQFFTMRLWLLLVPMIVISGVSISTAGAGSHESTLSFLTPMLGMMILVLLLMSFFAGPQIVRQDFRQDLPMADLMKTWPLPAWQLALGELLAPVAILTAIQWCLILLAMFLCTSFGTSEIPFGPRLAVGLSLAVLAPFLNVLTLIIPNAAVLLFPGWFQTGGAAQQGIEVIGQRLIFALGQVIVLLLALIPASVVFWLVIYLGGSLLGHLFLSLPVAALGAALVVAAEGALGMLLLGHLFQRLDLSSETVI